MEAFNSLMLKGLVSLESVKDLDSRFNEVVNLDKVYECVTNSIESDVKEKNKEDIFKVFERELGRTISSMELEMINGWLATGTSEEIILGALKEAVYNGVSNFRYIDKIIYEWGKKGFKTMDDVNQYMKNRRESKSKDSKVDKKEQEILDYDWLDD
jgi:DNA replication protein